MTLKVLFFSLLRDISGCEETEVRFEGQESLMVGELLERLYHDWPKLRDWDEKILVAADHEYVSKEAVLTDGQEVAIMPPVQGG